VANELNFAREPFTNERLPRLIFSLLVTFVLGLMLVHGFLLGRYLLREQEELDLRVTALRSEVEQTNDGIARAKAAIDREQTARGNERTRFLVRLYRQKGFSWTGLFNELEAIVPGPIRITSIAPSEEDGQITVTMTLVGKDLRNVLEMVKQLESSSFFATVFPINEANLEDLGRDETGVVATLHLQYLEQERPVAPEIEDETAPSPAPEEQSKDEAKI
jgi:Tfp pilus assembly protein PilN